VATGGGCPALSPVQSDLGVGPSRPRGRREGPHIMGVSP
jgi:hypothetical protein